MNFIANLRFKTNTGQTCIPLVMMIMILEEREIAENPNLPPNFEPWRPAESPLSKIITFSGDMILGVF